LKAAREGETQQAGDVAKNKTVKQEKRSVAATEDVKYKDIGGVLPPDIAAYKVSGHKLSTSTS
jgi:hypothetical protein